MGISRVACFMASCKICKKHILVKNFWRDNKIICNPFPRKHDIIKADDCGHFRCSEYGSLNFCNYCSAGYPKVLKNKSFR